MTPQQTTAGAAARQDPDPWTRADTAQAFADFADPYHPPFSQRQYAQEHAIPRSTLGDWLRRPDPAGLDPQLVAFFRCPAGEAFLRRLVYAAALVFTQHNACGIRQVGLFLRFAQLDQLVGSSYGALHPLAVSLETTLAAFEAQHRPLLAAPMSPRSITACADENFHGRQMCLVAIEPLSGFLLLEAYADNRDASTWADALNKATCDLPVEIIQLTSDLARGLLCCAGQLQAVHSPDLFHLQRDLSGPVLLPLGRRVRQADKELQKTQGQIDRLDAACAERHGVSPEGFARMLELVRGQVLTQGRREEDRQRQERAAQALRGLSADYHPFDPVTGRPVSAEQAQQRLSGHVAVMAAVVGEAGLPEKAQEAVSKARSWVGVLAACVGWFWSLARQRVQEVGLSEEAETAVYEQLLPGLYWQQAAGRATDPQQRARLQELGRRLQEQAWSESGALAGLGDKDKEEVKRVVGACAGLFQRSSSCVEGRNGRLSLQHHGQTRLSERKLRALGVVHNYGIRRDDGTTAAERFFGAKHPDLFTWLLQRLPDLPRPAAKRPPKGRQGGQEAA
jgi:hypothetical protein